MKQALKHVLFYLVLAPYGNEQSDFLHRLFLDKNLEEVPKYKWAEEVWSLDVQRRLFVVRELLQRFKTQELIQWKDLLKSFENELKNGSKEHPATGVFAHTEDGKKRWEYFKDRVVEHVRRFLTGHPAILPPSLSWT